VAQQAKSGPGRLLLEVSRSHSVRHTTVGRTPLDEGSASRRDLYLTTQTLYKRQTSMPPVGFEPTIPASARPQTYALDRAVAGIGSKVLSSFKFIHFVFLRSSTHLFAVSIEGFDFSLDHTQTHTTVGRTSLYEGSDRRRDLYLTTFNTQKRETPMPSVRFEPTITASTRPKAHTLSSAATEIGEDTQ
jgi:hypothetical protein